MVENEEPIPGLMENEEVERFLGQLKNADLDRPINSITFGEIVAGITNPIVSEDNGEPLTVRNAIERSLLEYGGTFEEVKRFLAERPDYSIDFDYKLHLNEVVGKLERDLRSVFDRTQPGYEHEERYNVPKNFKKQNRWVKNLSDYDKSMNNLRNVKELQNHVLYTVKRGKSKLLVLAQYVRDIFVRNSFGNYVPSKKTNNLFRIWVNKRRIGFNVKPRNFSFLSQSLSDLVGLYCEKRKEIGESKDHAPLSWNSERKTHNLYYARAFAHAFEKLSDGIKNDFFCDDRIRYLQNLNSERENH